MERILITGVAGFIGSSLCDRLLAEGHKVIGIDDFDSFYARDVKVSNLAGALDHAAFSMIEEDLLSADLAAVLDGATCVYHLAAQAGVRTSWGASFETYVRNNVLATQRLLEACVAAGTSKVVYASSSSVYGEQEGLPLVESMPPNPRSPYGVTKLAGEHLCLAYHANHGLDTTSLRFFTVYGPRQRPDMAFHRFIRAMLEGRPIIVYGDGHQTRDFTFVDDVVTALAGARRASPGVVMNIGGGHRVSLVEAIDVLQAVLSVEAQVEWHPAEAGDVRDTWADTGRIRRVLNFVPRTELADGLLAEAEWLRARLCL